MLLNIGKLINYAGTGIQQTFTIRAVIRVACDRLDVMCGTFGRQLMLVCVRSQILHIHVVCCDRRRKRSASSSAASRARSMAACGRVCAWCICCFTAAGTNTAK